MRRGSIAYAIVLAAVLLLCGCAADGPQHRSLTAVWQDMASRQGAGATVASQSAPTARPSSGTPTKEDAGASASQSAITPEIQAVAETIQGENDFDRLYQAMKYIIEHFAYDPQLNTRQFGRTAQELFTTRTLGGCSDYALAGLALFRAMNIPSMLVLTASLDWIERHRNNPLSVVYGHSFIEVLIGERWYLVDPNHFVLYERYNPAEPFYPRKEVFLCRGYDFWDLGLRSQEQAWELLLAKATASPPVYREPSLRERFTVKFNMPRLFTGLGDILSRNRNDFLALKRYSRALEYDPGYAPAYVNRAEVYLRLSKYSDALRDLDQAQTLDPRNARVYYFRGLAYKGLGDMARMQENLQRAAALGVHDAEPVQ